MIISSYEAKYHVINHNKPIKEKGLGMQVKKQGKRFPSLQEIGVNEIIKHVI